MSPNLYMEVFDTMNTSEVEDQFSIGVYPKREVTLVRGKGSKVYDEAGKEYLDCVTGIGTQNVGHCNPKIVEAIKTQLDNMMSCVEIFHNDTRAELLKKLAEIAPAGLDRSFLCNSGAEAVEAAFKFARISTGRKKIIAAMRGFHGRTFGALSATWKKKYREPFEPLLPGVEFVPYNNFEAIEQKADEETAAIILEPVQGEGGIYPGDPEYFQSVRKLCDEKGILLIIDEIQTGFGRTGKMFALEHLDVVPDMICCAKSIAAGIPMGAVICNSKIEVPKMMHGSTFGGNPVSCAAALATIQYIQDNNLCERAAELGEYFKEKLSAIKNDKIKELRIIGLMIGIDLTEKPQPYLKELMELGVMALPAGNTVLRLLPPLTIEKDEIDFVVEQISKVL